MAENKLVIDARGDACPIPVVKTLKALGTLGGPGVVETIVDNKICVQNLTRMGENKGCAVATEQTGEKEWHVTVSADHAVEVAATEAAGPDGRDSLRSVVVQVCSDAMGVGDDELGRKLLKGFIYSLTQLDELPTTLLFYNGGAHLTCEGSPVLDDLRDLADAGVEVLSCGTCLDYYGLTDKLVVGGVTNLYVIAQKLTCASVVVRP